MRKKQIRFNLGLEQNANQLVEKQQKQGHHRTELRSQIKRSDPDYQQIHYKKHMKKIGQGHYGVVHKMVSDDMQVYAVKETQVGFFPSKSVPHAQNSVRKGRQALRLQGARRRFVPSDRVHECGLSQRTAASREDNPGGLSQTVHILGFGWPRVSPPTAPTLPKRHQARELALQLAEAFKAVRIRRNHPILWDLEPETLRMRQPQVHVSGATARPQAPAEVGYLDAGDNRLRVLLRASPRATRKPIRLGRESGRV